MGMKEDLRRNRTAQRLLTGDDRSRDNREEVDFFAGRAGGYREQGRLEDAAFAARVAELEATDGWDSQTKSADLKGKEYGFDRTPTPAPTRYSLGGLADAAAGDLAFQSGLTMGRDIPAFGLAETARTPVREGETSIVHRDGEPAQRQSGPEGEDLLESLLQRLEVSARRYPQDLTEKE